MEWWIWLIISVSIIFVIFIVYKLYMGKNNIKKSRSLQHIEKSEENNIKQKNNIDEACERWRAENEKSLEDIGIGITPPNEGCKYSDEEDDDF